MKDKKVPPLRGYQEAAVGGLADAFMRGNRRMILCAPTGSGKTVCAAHIVEHAQSKGKRVAFLVDRIALVHQTSREFAKFGIPHGVIQGDATFGANLPMVVASMQSLESRGFMEHCDLAIVDECHIQRKAVMDYLEGFGGLSVGLTATPLTDGLGKFWDGVVSLVTTNKLIKDGWLAGLKVYAAKEIDMAGAKTSAGEWTGKEVERRGAKIIGDIPVEWMKCLDRHFDGEPAKTIVFSATVEHGRQLCEAFANRGFNFKQVSYLDDDETKKRNLEEFRNGEIHGIVNCEALHRGLDVPDIRILIAARPYRSSLASHIQQLGRVMRPWDGKDHGLVLDHSGNYIGFLEQTEDFFENGPPPLDMGDKKGKSRKRTKKPREELVCRSCSMVVPPGVRFCMGCGTEIKRRRGYETVDGMMKEIDRKASPSPDWLPSNDSELWSQVCAIAVEKRGFNEFALRSAQGYFKGMRGRWPRPYRSELDPCLPTEIIPELRNAVLRKAQNYARRMAYAKDCRR